MSLSRFELEANEAELRARILSDGGDSGELAFQKERLGDQVRDVTERPIFWGEGMLSEQWEYNMDVEGALIQGKRVKEYEEYTPFRELSRAVARVIRQDPALVALGSVADYVVLNYLKEGSHHGIYKVVFVFPDGSEMARVVSVSKSPALNELTRMDADQLKRLAPTGVVPQVYGYGVLPLDSQNVYMVLEFLPCHEISIHREGEARIFQFLDGGESLYAPTGVPHEYMGDRMAETLFMVMFFDESLKVIPQVLRGDLVWMEDGGGDEGKVCLISTLNAMSLAKQPYAQKQLKQLTKYMESPEINHPKVVQDVFALLSAIGARWDSESIDRFYREVSEEQGIDVEAPDRSHIVYPYTASNLLHGLFNSGLEGKAFERAFFSLYYAVRFMTAEGTKRRVDSTLAGLCAFYEGMHDAWELSLQDQRPLAVVLREKLAGIRFS